MTNSLRDAVSTVPVGPATNFWRAFQSENFRHVFHEGTLWAPLKGHRGQSVPSWDTLPHVRPGDVVLNFDRPAVRGISIVATRPVPSYPPLRGYKEPAGTNGILVLTDPLCEVRIPREDAYRVLPWGQGPVNAKGGSKNGYVFRLDRDAALKLLRQAGLEIGDGGDVELSGARPSDPQQYKGGPSDKWTLAAVRTEQRYLRCQQLQLHGSHCSLCGHSYPEEFLVAAHIKPRSKCSEAERMDIRNVSMLACLFGCDALFENGYLVVGADGSLRAGKPGRGQVWYHAEELLGRMCIAHNERSQGYFAWHREHHLADVADQR
ncbi:HNH endonuclease [Pseudarthrobacter sp. NIBRBAC000502770]|uniref:HNH endonuclease n=1 Tax=Pseudarthrobacter sp. NIBRBAC000502770 TaxID=2590785 RepID=UPI001140556F|nr:HNH endonuclease [Pseudarthrobacter sp. NIBRBAC000502770]QDG89037.1 HNH endonuclease [Pseudarthrobacter sp. NIBRBAC000502770]